MLSGHRFIPCISICSTSVPHRCDLCDTEWPWLDNSTTYGNPLGEWDTSRGLETFWPVTRATFPHHAIFEGLNNIPMEAPIALRAVGIGFSDGHVADLYSAGAGSVFGLLSPIMWMRQAVSPFLDREDVEYRYTESVLAASASDDGRVDIKKFRSERTSGMNWVLWLFFCPKGSVKMSLSVASEPKLCAKGAGGCHWYTMEGGGSARVITDCEDQVECTVTAFTELDPVLTAPAFAGAVLVVGGASTESNTDNETTKTGASSPTASNETTTLAIPGALTLARMELTTLAQPELFVTICNVGAKTLQGAVSISFLETEARLNTIGTTKAVAALPRTIPFQVPAYACATSSVRFNMSVFELPLHLQLNGVGIVPDLRRLAPVTLTDPHFRLRRYSSAVMPRPDNVKLPPSSSPEVPSPFVMSVSDRDTDVPCRNIYWPASTSGRVHVRFLALFGPSRQSASHAQLSFGMESWR